MPSESSFKKQVALAQDALKNFTAVQSLKSTAVLKAAISELIDSTIAFNHFIPFFLSHPLFQEISPAVLHVLEKFIHKNPNFDMPSGYSKIVSLDARIRDSLSLPISKGMSFLFCLISFFSNTLSFSFQIQPPPLVRVLIKVKRVKLQYVLLYFLFYLVITFYFSEQAPSSLKRDYRRFRR